MPVGANQNPNVISSKSFQSGCHQADSKYQVLSVDVEKEALYIAGGNVSECNHYGKQYGVSQGIYRYESSQNWMAYDQKAVSHLEDLFKENKALCEKEYLNSNVCCSTLLQWQKWKQIGSLTDEWTNKMWCVSVQELKFSLRHHPNSFVTPWCAHKPPCPSTTPRFLRAPCPLRSADGINHLVLGTYISSHKKWEILPFWQHMNESTEGILFLSTIESQTRGTNTACSLICGI